MNCETGESLAASGSLIRRIPPFIVGLLALLLGFPL
jgi:hypothetical protein